MLSFKGKEILLGVTGSIAAYKACELASRMVEWGARVIPALTDSAAQLVGEATFEALCGQPVIRGLFDPLQKQDIEHIAVAQRADLFLIAPATANMLAKAAHGIADDWLSTTLLATRAPILFAPAMNTNMYTHPATQTNIATLIERGCHFVGPGEGRLACGTVGPGRMAEPTMVLEAAIPLLNARNDFAGRHVVITSGGTQEPIDLVRFMANRSSGKMGRALALEALMRGARVTVITGPTAEVPLPYGVEKVKVDTALQMYDAVMARLADADVIIGAAAVGDYRLETPVSEKRKRDGHGVTLTLVENPDIIAEAGRNKTARQVVVAFAAETGELTQNAKQKLAHKNADIVFANDVASRDAGFGVDHVRAIIIDSAGETVNLGYIDKTDAACALFNHIAQMMPQT